MDPTERSNSPAKINRPAAGKTGTSQSLRDAWFIGFTSNLVVGVYVGMDNPQPLGKFETGSKTALPIFKNFVKNALYEDDFKEFSKENDLIGEDKFYWSKHDKRVDAKKKERFIKTRN